MQFPHGPSFDLPGQCIAPRIQPRRVPQRPLIGATFGLAVDRYWLGLGTGGTTRVAVLAASASCIAIPPAVRMGIPEANPSLYAAEHRVTQSKGLAFCLLRP